MCYMLVLKKVALIQMRHILATDTSKKDALNDLAGNRGQKYIKEGGTGIFHGTERCWQATEVESALKKMHRMSALKEVAPKQR